MLSPILLTHNPRFQDLSLTGMDITFMPECPAAVIRAARDLIHKG